MRIVFLLFITFFSNNSIVVAQNMNLLTEEGSKSSTIKNELNEQKKKEWETYLVRVQESEITKQKVRQKDSIENSKVKTIVTDNDLDVNLIKCLGEVSPNYTVKSLTTGLDVEIPANSYIRRHIVDKFRYPEFAKIHGLQGKVIVYFMIDQEGNVQIKEAVGPQNGLILEEEAIRIIQLLPKAKPAYCDGKPISVKFSIPVNFKIQE